MRAIRHDVWYPHHSTNSTYLISDCATQNSGQLLYMCNYNYTVSGKTLTRFFKIVAAYLMSFPVAGGKVEERLEGRVK